MEVKNPTTREVPVVLTDDHSIVRHAIKTILDSAGGYRVVGEAEDAEQTMELLRRVHPELLILDLGLPGKSGIEALYEIRKEGYDTRVVVVTMYDDETRASQALSAGAVAYMLKNTPPEDFLKALAAVQRGESYVSPNFQHLLSENGSTSSSRNKNGAHGDPLGKLSSREREVFYLLADGLPNRVIAKKLFISPRTVETHRARVIKKLGFNSTADLIRYAIRNNLVAF